MTISIRPLTVSDMTQLADLDDFAFVADPTRPDRETTFEQVDWRHAFGASRSGEYAGSYLVHELQLGVPGPLGGVRRHYLDGLSWVTVHPDHRRSGVLTAMIEHHLADARTRGVAWSGLTASETGIYGRFGYGVATMDVRCRIDTGTTLAAPEAVAALARDVQVHTLFDLDDETTAARMRALSLACADTATGTVTWPQIKERAWLRDHPRSRRGTEPMRALVATRDGVDVGAAVFTRSIDWEDGQPDGRLTVRHLQCRDGGALLALGRRLLDHDLMRTVELTERGFDDPLLWWAGGPRAVRARVRDGLWLRPIDVGAALGARGYACECDVVLDVIDDVCTWNAGAWRLRVGADGRGLCEPTDRPADVRVRVQGLGPAYLGLRGWAALAACGEAQQIRSGAMAELTAAFATGQLPLGGRGF